jgi:DNA polymerase-3 subunit delta'
MTYPWQQNLWQRLIAQHREGRLPHALLLKGSAGLGKQDFALALASALLCRKPAASGEACGSCETCSLVKAGTHPDWLQLAPEAEGKAIRVDDVRELSASLTLTSQFGGYKVAIIAVADAMNMNAANSLLKTLEEPTANSVLILVSSRPHRLPITIRSRCQSIEFRAPEWSQARDWLAQEKVADADLMLRLAHGAPLLARELAQDETLAQRKALMEALLQTARNKSFVSHAETLSKLSLDKLLGWLHDWLADLVKLQTLAQSELTNTDYQDELKQMAGRLDAQRVYGLLDEVLKLRQLQSIPLNAQMLWEDLLLSWQQQLTKA